MLSSSVPYEKSLGSGKPGSYRKVGQAVSPVGGEPPCVSMRTAQGGEISMIRWALAATLFAVLWTFTPPAEPHIRLCGFFWLTGHPCALCGMTRAMFALAKGHFAEAEHFNALAP